MKNIFRVESKSTLPNSSLYGLWGIILLSISGCQSSSPQTPKNGEPAANTISLAPAVQPAGATVAIPTPIPLPPINHTAPVNATSDAGTTSPSLPHGDAQDEKQREEKQSEDRRTHGYIRDLDSMQEEIDRAQNQFERVTNNPDEKAHFEPMLIDNLMNYNKALTQLDALKPPLRFQSIHDDLRRAIQGLRDDLASTLQAAQNQNEAGVRTGLFGIGNSYQTLGSAQMAMGKEMMAFGREQEQQAVAATGLP